MKEEVLPGVAVETTPGYGVELVIDLDECELVEVNKFYLGDVDDTLHNPWGELGAALGGDL